MVGFFRMDYTNLLVEIRPPLAIVTVNRPKVLNALNAATIAELDSAFARLAPDPSVRVVLLTGAGEKAFVAGADISELAPLSAAEAQSHSEFGQAVFRRIEQLGKPVIACINGFALGGGCELAMACTLRIASFDAKLGQPEVKLGLIPGYGGSQRLPRLVGRGAALKIMLTGGMIDADEAYRIGLVDQLAKSDELMSSAEVLARAIANNAPLAVSEVISAVDEGLELRIDSAMAREAEGFGRMFATQDKIEGTTAFLEKRKAVWRGR
jgi:enoyl-CoA hydratase